MRLDSKLKRTAILYKKSVAKLGEVRKYILNSTDDERPYLSSSLSQGANLPPSRPQSEQLLSPAKYQTYTGAFREDRRNGLGRCQYQDGSVYHGQWLLDMREGDDCTYITKKFRYTGSFKADMISGYGKQVFVPEGEEYEGQFFEGARHGQGIFIHKDGLFQYEGEWKYGRRSGIGKLTSTDGSYFYDGEWKRDLPHGFGKERMLNGDFYEGSYVHGLREGHGKYQFVKNGSVYVGQWLDGLFHGRGQKWNIDGYHFDGCWIKGRASGYGVQMYPNKDKYEGFFQNDQRSGLGIYYFASMEPECLCYGNWQRGQPDAAGELRWVQGHPTPQFLKWRETILKISNFSPSP